MGSASWRRSARRCSARSARHPGTGSTSSPAAIAAPCARLASSSATTSTTLARSASADGIDPGELCVYLVKQQTWLGLLLLPIKVALGLADPAHDVELLRVSEVELRSGQGSLRVSLDGETPGSRRR